MGLGRDAMITTVGVRFWLEIAVWYKYDRVVPSKTKYNRVVPLTWLNHKTMHVYSCVTFSLLWPCLTAYLSILLFYFKIWTMLLLQLLEFCQTIDDQSYQIKPKLFAAIDWVIHLALQWDTFWWVYQTVNHSENFMDPRIGTTTNTVECIWKNCKQKFKSMLGVYSTMLPGHLDEFL